MNEEESKSINVTRTCDNEDNKHENTLSMYDNKDKETTLITSEKEGYANEHHEEPVKACDCYISIYECSKQICQSTHGRT